MGFRVLPFGDDSTFAGHDADVSGATLECLDADNLTGPDAGRRELCLGV